MTAMNGPLDLDAIEARADAATPAAWSAIELAPNEHFKHPEYWVEAEYDADSGTTLKTVAECTWSMADAEFIARARQDVPALAAEVRLLRRKLTLLFLAAEAVESEADDENRSSRGLADMRRIMNAIPASALNDTPAAELVDQDEAVTL